MYSHLGETLEDVQESMQLVEKLNRYPLVKVCTFQPTMIFPGTTLEIVARQRHLLRDDFSWYEPYESEFNRHLGQIPNIPLFRDLLTPENLIEISEMSQVFFK